MVPKQKRPGALAKSDFMLRHSNYRISSLVEPVVPKSNRGCVPPFPTLLSLHADERGQALSCRRHAADLRLRLVHVRLDCPHSAFASECKLLTPHSPVGAQSFIPPAKSCPLPPLHSNPLPLLEPPLLTPLLTLPSFGPESGCGGTAACLATLACHPSFRSCLVSGFGGVLQTPVARGKKTSSGTGGGGNAAAQSPTD